MFTITPFLRRAIGNHRRGGGRALLLFLSACVKSRHGRPGHDEFCENIPLARRLHRDIRVFGRSLRDMTENELFEMRAHVGMVFQESALFDSLDVEDNVAYRLEEEHVDPKEIRERVLEALRFVELEQVIDKFPSELSGGMRRRVSIARAIISKPDLILYDSPTGGLDPITSTTIIELVVKQRDVSHTTCLLITHRLQDAFMLATHRFNPQDKKVERIPGNGIDASTKFLVLNEGHIVFDGTTLELTHTKDPWLREYLE